MNAAPFSRLLWKEYRQQRAFWLAAMLIIVMILCLSGIAVFLNYEHPRDFSLLFLGEILSVFYALGCGAMLFAGEHENGTFEFQRNLPLTGSKVFWAKAVFSLLSTAAFACVLAIPAFLADRYFGYHMPDSSPWYYWCYWCLTYAYILGLALLWGTLCSLIIKRVLLATFLGASAGIGVSLVGRAILVNAISHKDGVLAIVFFSADFVALILANIWLGRRWFQNRVAGGGRLAARWGLGESARDAAGSENMARTNKKIILGRLVWQQWRFSRLLMGVYALAFAALFVLLTTSIFRTYDPDHLHEFFYPVLQGYSLFLYCCLISLFGASVFQGDQQRHSVRFLAERAADPRHVWLSRQAVWFAPPLLIFFAYFIYLVIHFASSAGSLSSSLPTEATWLQKTWSIIVFSWHHLLLQPAKWLAIITLLFAAGQLCSMLFRSALLAAVFGLGLGGLCAAWAAFMIWLGANPLWSSLPIAAGMLAATWLYAPNWMRERTGFRQYLRPAAAILAPLAAVIFVIPFYRVYSIPGAGPGFDVAEYTRPATAEEQATLEMYRQACNLVKPHPKGIAVGAAGHFEPTGFWNLKLPANDSQWHKDIKADLETWVKANPQAIKLALAAGRRRSCGNFSNESGINRPTMDLANLLVIEGNMLTEQGKLDLAAERFNGALRITSHLGRGLTFRSADRIEGWAYHGLRYWAAAPDQTPERIKAVIKEIDAIDKTRPSREEYIKQEYMLTRSIITSQGKEFEGATLSEHAADWMAAFWYSLPWEKARMLRMLDKVTAEDLESWKNLGDPSTFFYEWTVPRFDSLPSQLIGRSINEGKDFFDRSNLLSGNFPQTAFYELNARTERRATKIILALEAWRLEHGELPNTLDKLVGPYFKKLPVPPRAGTVFAYFPKGLPKELWAFPSEAGNYGKYEPAPFGPNVPLLLVCSEPYRESGGREITESDEMEIPKRYRLNPEDILVNDGFAFPIP